MDRREALNRLSAAGAGIMLGSGSTCQADHGAAPHAAGGPVTSAFSMHFCGIHVAKKDPKIQLIAHHHCGPCGDMHQCLLFDGPGAGAKLLGVEYIVSDEIFRKLPESEQKYWHPHTYEVLAGGLTAPDMKPADELAFMKALLTTWGKTWHTWPDPTTPVPLGEPLLMWSLTGDGQTDEKILAERDRRLKVSAAKIREERTRDLGLEVPQVPFPKSVETIGRQWTESGPDTPKKRP